MIMVPAWLAIVLLLWLALVCGALALAVYEWQNAAAEVEDLRWAELSRRLDAVDASGRP